MSNPGAPKGRQARLERYEGGRPPWYKLRLVWAAAAVAVIGAAYLTDRYDNYSAPQRSAILVSFVGQLKSDLGPCNDGVTLTFTRWSQQLSDTPGAPTPAALSSLARSAEAHCTPASSSAYALISLQAPGALSPYPEVGLAVYQLGSWTYPNAANALLAIETLAVQPSDPAAKARLDSAESAMRAASAQASALLSKAAKALGAKIPALDLATPPSSLQGPSSPGHG